MAELLHGDSLAERPCPAPVRTGGEAAPPFSATCARTSRDSSCWTNIRDSSAASVHEEDDATFAEMELEVNAMDICLLLADPIDEKDINVYLGGHFMMPTAYVILSSHALSFEPACRAWFTQAVTLVPICPLDDYAHQQSGNDSFSVSWDVAVEDEQAFADRRVEDYLEPSMLDLSKRRGQRRRRSTPWRVEINHLLDLVKPATKTRRNGVKPTAKRRKNDLVKPNKRKRKNKKHMTFQEVANLVKGASKHGAGNWKMVHDDYFQTSIRSDTNLKDKWRNLVKACKGRVKKPHLRTSRIIESFGDIILKLESEYAARQAAESQGKA
ncbi:hypothetical protein ACP4OV_010220 [Aristida adscensionis]